MSKRPYKVLVIYKSGARVEFKCSEFSIKVGGGTRSATWKDAKPNPLFLNVDDIESVWEVT